MILFRKCPCCKNHIVVFKDSVCKYERNHRCHYCPKCHNQITPPKKVKRHNNTAITIVMALTFILLSIFPDNNSRLKFIFWFIPVAIGINLIWLIMVGALMKLSCIQEPNDKQEIKRDNSDIWGSNMPFMQMDEIEKKIFIK